MKYCTLIKCYTEKNQTTVWRQSRQEIFNGQIWSFKFNVKKCGN